MFDVKATVFGIVIAATTTTTTSSANDNRYLPSIKLLVPLNIMNEEHVGLVRNNKHHEEETVSPGPFSSSSLSSSWTACCAGSYGCTPCDSVQVGQAFDLIVIRKSEVEVAAGEVLHGFDARSIVELCHDRPSQVVLEIISDNDDTLSHHFPLNAHGQLQPIMEVDLSNGVITRSKTPSPKAAVYQNQMVERLSNGDNYHDDADDECATVQHHHDPLALQQLAQLLQPGPNNARYVLIDVNTNHVLAVAPMQVFLWDVANRVFVLDIDGTVTASNVRGLLDTVVTKSYTHVQPGVCAFLTVLSTHRPELQTLYLTSRPLSLASATRQFLTQVRQDEAIHSLPAGPLLGFGGTLRQVLTMELITKDVQRHKIATIERQVLAPFRNLGLQRDERSSSSAPLHAAFGNHWMDMEAYHHSGLQLHQCYYVDNHTATECGVIYCLDHPTAPLPTNRREYRHHCYTKFVGYHDTRLLAHVTRQRAAAVPQVEDPSESSDLKLV